MVKLKKAAAQDWEAVKRLYPHMSSALFENRIATGSAYLICDGDVPVGVMHHCLFWDALPCLSLLYLPEPYRRKGFGSFAMGAWEEEMREQGAKMVLTSTQVDEDAQHFYRKLGYIDCGTLVLGSTPFDQPMEMFMRKVL